MPRVKCFGCMPRRSDVSVKYFHDHYRHPHGTIGRRISTFSGYVQSHQVHTDLLDEQQTRFEACAEIWFDCVADALNFPTEPTYVKDLIPDEPLFVDLDKLRVCFAEEEVLMSGPDLRKDLSNGDAAWRVDNRPLSFKLLQFIEEPGAEKWDADDDLELGERIGALRHVRCRPVKAIHRKGAFVVGIRELWWPTQLAMEEGAAGDMAAWKTLLGRPSVATVLVATAERFI